MSLKAIIGTTVLVTVTTTVISQIVMDLYKAAKARAKEKEERAKNAASTGGGGGGGFASFSQQTPMDRSLPGYGHATLVSNAGRNYDYNFPTTNPSPSYSSDELMRRASDLDLRERDLFDRERKLRLVV
jgi:hypothetical protein